MSETDGRASGRRVAARSPLAAGRRAATAGVLAATALGSTLAGGCVAGPDAAQAPETAAAMPAVQLVSVRGDTASPGHATSAIVVGRDGALLFKNLPGEAHPLIFVAPGGSVVQELSRRGEGPGELRQPSPLAITDSSVIAWDASTDRLSEWTRRGFLVRSIRAEEPVAVFGWAPGRGALATRERGKGTEIVLVDLRSGRVRPVLDPQDPAYQQVLPPVRDYSTRLANLPAIGSWREGVLLGNGLDYRIGLFDWRGRLVRTLTRDLGANHRGALAIARDVAEQRAAGRIRDVAGANRLREQLAREPIPWFGHLVGPTADSAGRIWVVGVAGDSTFADVFGPPRFLGRIVLPCTGFQGRWSLAGAWLALMCAPDAGDTTSDGVLKLFRIVDGAAPGS